MSLWAWQNSSRSVSWQGVSFCRSLLHDPEPRILKSFQRRMDTLLPIALHLIMLFSDNLSISVEGSPIQIATSCTFCLIPSQMTTFSAPLKNVAHVLDLPATLVQIIQIVLVDANNFELGIDDTLLHCGYVGEQLRHLQLFALHPFGLPSGASCPTVTRSASRGALLQSGGELDETNLRHRDAQCRVLARLMCCC